MKIDYLGHASVRIDLDGVRFLTDPALEARMGPLRRLVAPVEAGALEGIDAVVVSHLHLDHLDLATLRRLPEGVRLIVPRGAGTWLRSQGWTSVVELDLGERTEVGGVGVRAVAARHGGYRPPRGPRALALGYVLEGRQTLYFAGDTGLYGGMREVAPEVDVALLPVGGWGPTLPKTTHLDPVRAAHAAALVRPRIVVPIHWGTYWPAGLHRRLRADPAEAPRRLVRAAAELAPDSAIRPVAIGEPVELS
jgi:L-ascorbate metabolism protein UlaG (beta-lactamase superfamily)